MERPYRTTVAENGMVDIPEAYRKQLALCPGDTVLLMIEDGELRVFTPANAVRRFQETFRKFVPEGVSLADELVAERHAEAECE